MAEVARLAGVAPITVSRVINNHPLVAVQTRVRVEKAIAELGYRSNMAARTLAGGHSRVLGVIGVETWFYAPVRTLVAIEAACRDSGYALCFTMMRASTVDEFNQALDHLRDAHVDGVAFIAPIGAASRALDVAKPGLPMVLTSGGTAAGASVSIDQVFGARLATAHLLAAGHQTVHHVRGPTGWSDADARADGWRRELRAHKRSAPRPLVGDWSPESGYAAGQRLAKDPSVTAVFVANDQMALGLILALRRAGRSVPGDISVVGFDATPDSAFYDPPLTTVHQDLHEVGRRSVELLVAMIAGAEPERIRIIPTLITRSSTAPPPHLRLM